jgi:hypothetical protein
MAGTLIDYLYVKLGLDGSEFRRGIKQTNEDLKHQREAYGKTTKQWDEDSKRALQTFHKIRNEIIGIAGAFFGLAAVKSWTTDLVHSDAALNRTADLIGMTTERLSQFQAAGEAFGIAKQGATDLLTKMYELSRAPGTSEMAEFATPKIQQMLNRAGLSMTDLMDRTKSAEDRLMMFADAAKRLGPDALFWMGRTGLFSPQQIEFLKQGAEGVRKLADSMPKIGEGAAKQAQQAEIAWTRAMGNIDNAMRETIYPLLPMFDRLLEKFSTWLGKSGNVAALQTAIESLGKSLADIVEHVNWTELGAGLRSAVEDAKDLANQMGGVLNVIRYIAAWRLGGPAGVAALAGWDLEKKIEEQVKEKNPKGVAAATALRGVGTLGPAGLALMFGRWNEELQTWFRKHVKDYATSSDFQRLALQKGFLGSGLDKTMQMLGVTTMQGMQGATVINVQNMTVVAKDGNPTKLGNDIKGQSGVAPNGGGVRGSLPTTTQANGVVAQ